MNIVAVRFRGLTVRKRARRTLSGWRARIAAGRTKPISASSFARYPSNAASQLMLLPDAAIAVIEPLSEACVIKPEEFERQVRISMAFSLSALIFVTKRTASAGGYLQRPGMARGWNMERATDGRSRRCLPRACHRAPHLLLPRLRQCLVTVGTDRRGSGFRRRRHHEWRAPDR